VPEAIGLKRQCSRILPDSEDSPCSSGVDEEANRQVNDSETADELLAELSLLFGAGDVPADLFTLWAAQEAEQTDLLDSFELILMLGLESADLLGPLADDSGSDPAALIALGRMLDEIVFVAEAMDGMLLGYWLPPEATERVIVAVDDHGQISVQGATFAESLIAMTDPDDPDEAAEVVAELELLGITPPATTVETVLDRIQAVPEPNEIVLGYLLEARITPSS
jgi:hypothetical protein